MDLTQGYLTNIKSGSKNGVRSMALAAASVVNPTSEQKGRLQLVDRSSPAALQSGDGRSDWWRSAAIYQVYIRSFADGNGDGERHTALAC